MHSKGKMPGTQHRYSTWNRAPNVHLPAPEQPGTWTWTGIRMPATDAHDVEAAVHEDHARR